jgi:SAM-dependent methyltransferase
LERPSATTDAGTSARRRAIGFLRSARRVCSRAGPRGVVELVVARALPGLLSYERVTLIEAPMDDRELHPEMRPRRVRSSSPEIEEFHARLAATAEPEVPAFTPEDLRERFEAGHELWLFHEGEEIAQARWIVRDRLRFGGLTVPLAPHERAHEAVVTPAEFRRRGVNKAARKHLRAVLAGEGVTTLLSAIHGFNRRFLPSTLGITGARRVVTVHVVCIAHRRWYLAAPHAPTGVALLERGGLRTGRWTRDAAGPDVQSGRWDRAATRVLARPYLDPQMALVKRRAHLELLDRWLPDLHDASVLKTDLWEEGVAGDELLFTLARRTRSAHGIDVSSTTISAASRAAGAAAVALHLVQADVRELPIDDSSIDAIVSTSTIDHLPERDRPRALTELRRVLAPGGVLVITCDNADNVGDGVLQAAAGIGLVPFPLSSSLTLAELRELLVRAGFECSDHAYLVHGPRVLTTALARIIRGLPGNRSERATARMLRALDRVGRRAPAKMAAFVAVRATPLDGQLMDGRGRL